MITARSCSTRSIHKSACRRFGDEIEVAFPLCQQIGCGSFELCGFPHIGDTNEESKKQISLICSPRLPFFSPPSAVKYLLARSDFLSLMFSVWPDK